MRASFGIVFGRCGWGLDGGLVPAVRMGRVQLWCCRGSIFDRMAALHRALADAAEELRRGKK